MQYMRQYEQHTGGICHHKRAYIATVSGFLMQRAMNCILQMKQDAASRPARDAEYTLRRDPKENMVLPNYLAVMVLDRIGIGILKSPQDFSTLRGVTMRILRTITGEDMMNRILKQFLATILMVGGCLGTVSVETSHALEWVHEGMAEEGRITGGFRVGPSFVTQSSGVDTVGPLVNFQGMYGLNRWFRVGMILEWQRHGADVGGAVNTISILPVNLEYRPGHFGPFVPYLTTGIGVNINTNNVSDSFAWRFGGGVDYALTNLMPGAPQGLMLNVESVWKRNHANADGSTMGLLFGVRHTF